MLMSRWAAALVAAALRLKSEGKRSPVERLRESPRLDLVKASLGPNLEKLRRGRELFVYDLESASRTVGASRTRELDEIKPSRGVSPLGDALRDVLALHRGRPVAGIVLVSDGRSNAGEDPLRAAEAATRQGIPIFLFAAGADEGPRNVRLAEIEASPVVFARDPMTLGVVVEARGLRDTEGTISLEQRVNGSDWQAVGDQRVALGGNHLDVLRHPIGERTVEFAMAPEPPHVNCRITPVCGIKFCDRYAT